MIFVCRAGRVGRRIAPESQPAASLSKRDTILLTEDNGLHNPASITFGIGEDNQSILFTNYAVLPPEPAASPGPAVLKFDVGVPGLPSP